jgi:hypothetical protein
MSRNLNSAIAVIGIDIGKNSFHVVGLDSRGAAGRPLPKSRPMDQPQSRDVGQGAGARQHDGGHHGYAANPVHQRQNVESTRDRKIVDHQPSQLLFGHHMRSSQRLGWPNSHHFGGNIAMASTSNNAPGRASCGTPTVVLAGGESVFTYLSRTSR